MTLFTIGSKVFKAARKTSEIAQWSGAPKTVVNKNAIKLVRLAIADGPHASQFRK